MKFRVGDAVRIVGNTGCAHYAVVPSVGVVRSVLYPGKYDIECVNRINGNKITQTISAKDLASPRAVIL